MMIERMIAERRMVKVTKEMTTMTTMTATLIELYDCAQD